MRHLSDGERDLLAEQRAEEIDAARDAKSEEIERAARDLLEWADLILSEQYETPDEVPEIARMRAALGLSARLPYAAPESLELES